MRNIDTLPMPMLRHALLFALAAAVGASPSWPIAYSYSPDSMPIIEVRLAPPRKELPGVAAALNKMEADRSKFESEQMLAVEAAYKASWDAAVEKLPASIDRLMSVFEKPKAATSFRQLLTKARSGRAGLQAMSFHEARSELGGHELTARINVLAVARPDASLEQKIDKIEEKRSKDEGNIFKQAALEMEALTQVVESEVAAQVAQHVNYFVHAVKARSTGFLSAAVPVLASGLPLTTNVRVMAAEQSFHTMASMVEDLERKRDAGEGLVRTRLLELELKLLRAENDLVSDRLGAWMEKLLRASM